MLLIVMLAACSTDDPGESAAPDIVFDPATARATIDLGVIELAADGVDSTSLIVSVVDAEGRPIPDGSTLPLVTTHGTFTLGTTVGGAASGTFIAGIAPGRVGFEVEGMPTAGDAVTLVAGPAWSAQLHLHGPISERAGTYSFQVAEARRYGTDVLWWTEHDWGYSLQAAVSTPGIDEGLLVVDQPAPHPASSWYVVGRNATAELALIDTPSANGAPAMSIALTVPDSTPSTSWGSAEVRWIVDRNGLRRAVLGDVHLAAWLLVPDDGPSRARVAVDLSSTSDTDPQPAVLLYRDPSDDFTIDAHQFSVFADLARGTHDLDLDITQSAQDVLGTLDHGVDGVAFEFWRRGPGTSVFVLDGVELIQDVCCEDLRLRQRAWLDETFTPPPVQYEGQEISGGVPHLNVFGPVDVPLESYEVDTLPDDAPAMVARAHDLGAVVSMNHVFGAIEDPSAELGAAETCDALDVEGVYGVDLLEVGYIRRVQPLSAHLEVWDCLLRRGYLLTGLGTSDSHTNGPWELNPNRYTTWIYAPDPDAESLVDGLRAGRAFFGDPVWFAGSDLRFDLTTAAGGAMGIVTRSVDRDVVTVTASPLDRGLVVRLLADGELIATDVVSDPDYRHSFEVAPGGGDLEVRAEVWTAKGTPLLFSNPVFWKASLEGVPEARLGR